MEHITFGRKGYKNNAQHTASNRPGTHVRDSSRRAGAGFQAVMICKPCGLAADLLTYFDRSPNLQIGEAAPLATILHGDCKGGTHCDCKHSIALEHSGDKQERT